MKKLKNSNCDKTQKQKFWQLKNLNLDKTQIVRRKKLKNSKCEKLKLWQNSNSNYDKLKTQIVTKLKNSNCDEKKLKLLWNSKTQIVTKLKSSNYEKTQKLELWGKKKIIVTKLKMWRRKNGKTEKLTTQLVTKLKNSKSDKTLMVTKLTWILVYEERIFFRVFKYEHFDTLTTDEMFSGHCFGILAMFFTCIHIPTPPPSIYRKHCQVEVQKEYFWTSFSNHREIS